VVAGEKPGVGCAGYSRTGENGPQGRGYSLLHIRVRASAVFGDETVDPRGDNRQRDRAKLRSQCASEILARAAGRWAREGSLARKAPARMGYNRHTQAGAFRKFAKIPRLGCDKSI
jgi:hypothetical protein